MNNAYYIAANSMLTQEKIFDLISGNISNINTSGYKKTAIQFSDMLYNKVDTASDLEYNMGNGIRVNNYYKDFTSGPLRETKDPYDLSFEKEGFLKVTDGTATYFTRGGSFTKAAINDTYALANKDGMLLLDIFGQVITVDENDKDFIVSEDGLLTFENSGRTFVLDTISFENPQDLIPVGSDLYLDSPQLKENTQTADIILRQGFIEGSNVDLAVEMTDLIKAQRLYQINSKLVQVMDEISSLTNRLRK